jgi:hypothetical protein
MEARLHLATRWSSCSPSLALSLTRKVVMRVEASVSLAASFVVAYDVGVSLAAWTRSCFRSMENLCCLRTSSRMGI